MSETSWFAVQLISAICAGIFSVLVAFLLFLDTAVEDSRRAQIRDRAKAVLSTIEHSPLSSLPDHVLALGQALRNVRVRLLHRIVSENGWISWSVAIAAAMLCLWLVRRQYGFVMLFAILVGLVSEEIGNRLHFVRLAQLLGDTAGLLLAVLGFTAALHEAVNLAGTPFGIPIAIGVSPIGLVIADFLLSFGAETKHSFVPEWLQDAVYNAGAIVGISAFATVAAFSIGRLAEPLAPQPHLGLQALIANLGCDTASVIVCGLILSTTVAGGRRLPVPVMVSACLLCSLVFAWISLFLAFAGTNDALNALETSRVLVGLSPGGDRFELGVYFFLMHTTFLPTGLLMVLLGFAGAIKAATRSIEIFFRLAGKEHVNPIKAGAAALGVFVAIFTAASGIAGILKSHAHDEQVATQTARHVASTPRVALESDDVDRRAAS